MAIRTPLKAIRAKCLDCVNGQIYEINKCHIEGCPLWEYRTGHRPAKNVCVGGDSSEDISEDEEIIKEDISD